MHVFNAIFRAKIMPKGEATDAKITTKLEFEKLLKYVNTSINRVSFKAFNDCGTNQYLIAENLTIKLGLKHIKEPRWVNVVDQPLQLIRGVARNTSIKIYSWQGKVDLYIMPMSNF